MPRRTRPPAAPPVVLASPPPCRALSRYVHDGMPWVQQACNAFYHAQDGNRKFEALRRMIFGLLPSFVASIDCSDPAAPTVTPTNRWNPWLERCLRAFTNTTHALRKGDSMFRCIALTGCGGAGKTEAAGLYAVLWWIVDPFNSIVSLTSTTKHMVRNRAWSRIAHYWKALTDVETGERIEVGHMVDSMMQIYAGKGESKNSIGSYAVAHGETLKAIDNLKGMHAKRMLVIIDEANGTPEAILQIISNYHKGCQDLTVIVIGNPCTRLDPHGRACEPEDGWGIFNENLLEWRTKGVPDWQLYSGLCLRFDGSQSPNVRLGRNYYPYIYTVDDWRKAQDHPGTFAFWTQDRGMWPPEGFANTVFTEQLFARCETDTHYTFTGERESLAFLDPAFGGDACVLQFGELGDVGGRKCLQLTEWFEVPIDPNATSHDIDYQIARRVQQECIVRRIKPYCFGLDATGIGRGVGAILAAEWSPQIQYMNFGVGATERPSAQNDGRPAREVYNNFVCETWFAVREALEAGQITGFSREAISQFCSRLYSMNGKKYKLEPKPDMRERLRYSPDCADAVAGIVEVARRSGMEIAGKVAAVARTAWDDAVRQAQEDSPLDTGQLVEAGAPGMGWAEADTGVGGGW